MQRPCIICKGDHASHLCTGAKRIIFCGDRHWINRDMIQQVMKILYDNLGVFIVIEGECPTDVNADKLSRKVAEELGLPVDAVQAYWETYGRAAGPIRNSKMLREHRADAVVAFHDNLLKSKGTAHMVQIATNAKRPVWISTMGIPKLGDFIKDVKR